MVDDNELKRLSGLAAPAPSSEAKARALTAAMQAFDEKNSSAARPRIGRAGFVSLNGHKNSGVR